MESARRAVLTDSRMKISAAILRHSHVHRNWQGLRQIGGTLDGVYFELSGLEYVAKEVPPDRLYALQNNPAVRVILTGDAIGAASSVPADTDAPEDADTVLASFLAGGDEAPAEEQTRRSSTPPPYMHRDPRREPARVKGKR